MPLPDDAFWEAAERELADILFANLAACAKAGGQSALAGLGDGVSVDWSLVNQAAEQWARGMSLDLVKGITDTSRQHAANTIADWIETGGTMDDLEAALEPMFGPTRAQLVASTEVTRAFQNGNRIMWSESGVVDGVRWMTAADELVCPICGPRNGRQFGLDDEASHPPAHPRCRCYTQPVVNL